MSRERETVLVKSKIDDLAENKKVVLANRTDIDVNIHLSQPEPDSNKHKLSFLIFFSAKSLSLLSKIKP